MDTERRTEILETTLSRQLSWIAASDTKAAFIFGISTAMLGVLASAAPPYGAWTSAGLTFTSLGALLLAASVACTVCTVFPRTKGPKLSVIFFGGVARGSVDQFRSEMHALTEDMYQEDLVQQCHINAAYAARKYYWVKVATVFLAASVAPWLVATYVLFRDSN